jgi:hypothetical protein
MKKQLADALAEIVGLKAKVVSLSGELKEYAELEEGFYFLNEQRRVEKQKELTLNQADKGESQNESSLCIFMLIYMWVPVHLK